SDIAVVDFGQQGSRHRALARSGDDRPGPPGDGLGVKQIGLGAVGVAEVGAVVNDQGGGSGAAAVDDHLAENVGDVLLRRGNENRVLAHAVRGDRRDHAVDGFDVDLVEQGRARVQGQVVQASVGDLVEEDRARVAAQDPYTVSVNGISV